MRSPLAAALALALLGVVVASAPPVDAATRKPAVLVLAALPVVPERQSGYDRDLFPTWSDLDGNGCDTREDVLIAERIDGSVRGCDVVGGRWRSAYDGVVTDDSSSFDVDHLVPLADAWASGAWRWTTATRERYANDLGYAAALQAVTASSNRSKGDRDPAEWLPPLVSDRCAYVKQWVGMKYRWGLAVDSAEKSAITRVLSGCPPLMTVPARMPVTVTG